MATHLPFANRQVDRYLYIAMALVAAALVFIGFARTYYLRLFFTNVPLKPLLHVHAVLFTSWLILLLVQAGLVAANRTDLHRRVGVAGGVLAGLMLIVGLIVTIKSARGEFSFTQPGRLRFLVVPLFDILIFGTLVAAALYYRNKPQIHKRLMIVATFAILPAAVGRLPLTLIQAHGPMVFFSVNDAVLLGCSAYDALAHRRLHAAYLWSALPLIASHPLRLALAGTSAWLSFAHWLAGS